MEHRIPKQGYYLSSSIVPDFYGWIAVDGEPVQVYGATEANGKSIGYVEAKEGQQFVIHFADLRKGLLDTDCVVRAFIDGDKVQGLVLFRDDFRCSNRLDKFTGRQVTESTEQPFLFSKLKTTDSDDLACTDEQVVKNLGTIQLRYCRIRDVRLSTAVYKPQAVEPKMIHEKAKKAQLSHRAAYGKTVQAVSGRSTSYTLNDVDSSPLFQLEFRYRSRQLLQLEGYIPHSPTPSPEPEASASPAASSFSPVASTSSRSTSTGQNSQTPQVETNEATRLARLQAELDSLRRQERIAALQREIDSLQGEVGSNEGEEASSSSRKIKAEPSDAQREVKRIKQEIGERSVSQSSRSSKGKGKEKKKAEVIVLSDSD
ncbi:hypothetical protein JCM5350_003724 [Sporobolomyces pararoseus]